MCYRRIVYDCTHSTLEASTCRLRPQHSYAPNICKRERTAREHRSGACPSCPEAHNPSRGSPGPGSSASVDINALNMEPWRDIGLGGRYDKPLPPLPLFAFDQSGGDGGYSRDGGRVSFSDCGQETSYDGEYTRPEEECVAQPQIIYAGGNRSQATGPPRRSNRDPRPPTVTRGLDRVNQGKGQIRPVTRPGNNRSNAYSGDIPITYRDGTTSGPQRRGSTASRNRMPEMQNQPSNTGPESVYDDPYAGGYEPPVTSTSAIPRVIRRQPGRYLDRQNAGMAQEAGRSDFQPPMASSNVAMPTVIRRGGSHDPNPSGQMPQSSHDRNQGPILRSTPARMPSITHQPAAAHAPAMSTRPYEASYGDNQRTLQDCEARPSILTYSEMQRNLSNSSRGTQGAGFGGCNPLSRSGLGIFGQLCHKDESEESFACVTSRGIERRGA